jgi:DNA topoisomerase-1
MELIIAEKPEAMKAMADTFDMLDTIKTYTYEEDKLQAKIQYFENEEKIIVSASGHLYSVNMKRGGEFPNFEYEIGAPTFRGKNAKQQKTLRNARVELIRQCMEQVDLVIGATDNDIEGEVIFFHIIKNSQYTDEVKRMRMASLAPDGIMDAYNNLDNVNTNWAIAGEVRHIVDRLYGYNIPKGLTLAYREFSKRAQLINAGRVQTPLLRYIINREKEIKDFKSEKLEHSGKWGIKVLLPIDKVMSEDNSPIIFVEEGIPDEERIQSIVDTVEATIIEVAEHKIKYKIPVCHSLNDIRKKAYDKLKLEYADTDRILETLYLSKFISYPRDKSKKLTANINYHTKIIGKLSDRYDIKTPIKIPNIGEYGENIHPTGILPPEDLPYNYLKIYEMIVRRYLQTFCDNYIQIKYVVKWWATFYIDDEKEEENGEFEIDYYDKQIGYKIYDEDFFEKESIDKNILEIYKNKVAEKLFVESYIVPPYVSSTTPPDRIEKNKLFDWMLNWEIGTDATRVIHIENLNNNNFVRYSRYVFPTVWAMKVIDVISKYASYLTEVNTTKRMEKYLEEIENGDKHSKELLMNDIKDKINHFVRDIDNKLLDIGKELADFGNCPKCENKLNLVNLPGSLFIGCSDYPNCNYYVPI